ncbi:MAG: SDR family oxidoreductase [Chloroflexi bacterium]|nr:SDR family oxidoreductase [Chloroflexota bacterium]MBV9899108.1 SDR family oxidoreductase [Chloroflexota bacterium]
MDLGLKGKVAVVTGGSEGIGRAAAHSLGREGVSVVVCARRADVLERAAAEVAEATGAQIVPVQADVTRTEDIERVIQTAVDRFGRLDILVNNAGTSAAMRFEEITDEAWQADLELKLFGAIRATRAAIPHLRKVGGGSIVNLLNLAAKQPGARSYPTSVSRAAGMALMKGLSKELAADNIRVNGINIGLIKSGQNQRQWERIGRPGTLEDYYVERAKQVGIPLGRIGEAEEVGDLITFLCSNRATYITGVSINMDGGTSGVV